MKDPRRFPRHTLPTVAAFKLHTVLIFTIMSAQRPTTIFVMQGLSSSMQGICNAQGKAAQHTDHLMLSGHQTDDVLLIHRSQQQQTLCYLLSACPSNKLNLKQYTHKYEHMLLSKSKGKYAAGSKMRAIKLGSSDMCNNNHNCGMATCKECEGIEQFAQTSESRSFQTAPVVVISSAQGVSTPPTATLPLISAN